MSFPLEIVGFATPSAVMPVTRLSVALRPRTAHRPADPPPLPTGRRQSLRSAPTVNSPHPLGDQMAMPRPYVAAVAAAVLAALYFVPSAHGASTATTADTAPAAATAPASATASASASGSGSVAPASASAPLSGRLAETGMIDTKPYLIGGGVFLLAGAGLVVNATRRSRQALEAADAEDPAPEP
jgi:hypothetical protein